MVVSLGLALGTAVLSAPAASQASVLSTTGVVWSWGSGQSGELGNGTFTNSSLPVRVRGLGKVKAIATGAATAYVITADARVWSWGWNRYGMLGNGTVIDDSDVPVRVSGLTGVKAVAGGSYNGYALRSDGRVWAWGDGVWGNLGTGVFLGTGDSTRWSLVPVRVKNLSNVTAISGSEGTGYALRCDGTVWAWGLNNFGQLGNGSTGNSALPVKVSGLSKVVAIASRGGNGYALRSDGTVWAWGFGQYGELGNGTGDGQTLSFSRVPVRVSNLSHVTAIAAGGGTAYALRADHTVWAFGDGSIGQLGPDRLLSNVPVAIPGLRNVQAIAAGASTAYALTSPTSLFAWGYGIEGELGNNTTPFSSPTPVRVRRLPPVTSIAAGDHTAYALG